MCVGVFHSQFITSSLGRHLATIVSHVISIFFSILFSTIPLPSLALSTNVPGIGHSAACLYVCLSVCLSVPLAQSEYREESAEDVLAMLEATRAAAAENNRQQFEAHKQLGAVNLGLIKNRGARRLEAQRRASLQVQ
jgi:hypothetical protein